MKITFVVAVDNLSGGNRVIAIYAEHLQRLGHEVNVVVPPLRVVPKPERLRRAFGSLRRGRVQDALVDLRFVFRPVAHVPGFMERSSCRVTVLESHRPVRETDVPDADVVVATWWQTAHWVSSFGDRKGVKVYFMQDYGASGQELDKLIPTWKLGFHIVTIAEWLKALIQEHVPGAPVDVVGNAVDLEIFQQPPRSKPLQPAVGFMYRESWDKGYDVALEAWRLAKKELPELRFLAFGMQGREHLKHLPPEAEYHAGIPDQELASLYGACTAWLFASRLEGYGLPISEAMACGTPVIAARAGAAPELIERGGGWLVPTGDPRAMADAIVEACTLSPEDWKKASERARSSVSSYTWADAGDAFEAAAQRARARFLKAP